jgi:hypothetical protein
MHAIARDSLPQPVSLCSSSSFTMVHGRCGGSSYFTDQGPNRDPPFGGLLSSCCMSSGGTLPDGA